MKLRKLEKTLPSTFGVVHLTPTYFNLTKLYLLNKLKGKQSWRWELFHATYLKTMLVEITGTCHVRCCKKLLSLCRHSFYRNRFLNSTLVYAFDIIFPLKRPFCKSHTIQFTYTIIIKVEYFPLTKVWKEKLQKV